MTHTHMQWCWLLSMLSRKAHNLGLVPRVSYTFAGEQTYLSTRTRKRWIKISVTFIEILLYFLLYSGSHSLREKIQSFDTIRPMPLYVHWHLLAGRASFLSLHRDSDINDFIGSSMFDTSPQGETVIKTHSSFTHGPPPDVFFGTLVRNSGS